MRILKANDAVAKAAAINLESAICTSLLMLPETFSKEQLYQTIVGLSYTGARSAVLGVWSA